MKEKILEKATDLFLNLGFKSVTMDDLANELGMSKKTIYSHFDNKTKLIEESTLQLFNSISTGINKICSLDINPIEELYEIRKFVVSNLKDEKSSPIYQLQKYYPKIHKSLKQRQFAAMHDCVIVNIEKGIEQGLYRKNLDIEFISRIYFSGMTAIKDDDFFPPEQFSKIKLMDNYLEYHIRGIVTTKGKKVLTDIIKSNQS
ncbi:MAG: TetR/AcrR family transcriptional regulator [Cellulophaga sp.]|uniref:TetR/AcrR family transcriptional regulator n=1 Tax=unclassified Cellulophaga TaxID=2634405 RepID=UPI000C2C784C|nr:MULTISPECIES: TetR/AcrR family transcriptional regulator [unclassified Cellulophaga]MDO6490069.1 TetR/AcrR family transcriptional regulator [Cellulophaga sp. 2_MG-2023]MDO6494737.1 TetR/AcrR family transcriptional regulator [Cellulophaga sp. 3_MG-2023]